MTVSGPKVYVDQETLRLHGITFEEVLAALAERDSLRAELAAARTDLETSRGSAHLLLNAVARMDAKRKKAEEENARLLGALELTEEDYTAALSLWDWAYDVFGAARALTALVGWFRDRAGLPVEGQLLAQHRNLQKANHLAGQGEAQGQEAAREHEAADLGGLGVPGQGVDQEPHDRNQQDSPPDQHASVGEAAPPPLASGAAVCRWCGHSAVRHRDSRECLRDNCNCTLYLAPT